MKEEVKDNKQEPSIDVKDIGEINPETVTPAKKEAAVLQKAVDEGKVAPEYGLQDDGVYKVNLDKPPTPKEEIKEETKKEETNAVPEQETRDVPEDKPTGDIQKVEEEVRPVQESKEEIKEDSSDSPLELIKDGENNTNEEGMDRKPQATKPISEQKEILQEEKTQELPEGVDKLIQFMQETGGTVEDYAKLNRDYSKIDNVSLLKEYYEYTKPHLDKEDIQFLMDKNFSYDVEADDPSDVKAKQLAFKEEVYKAQQLLHDTKEKYYNDLKLSSKQKNIPSEYKEAVDFYNTSKQQAEQTNLAKKSFLNETNKVFNEEFKGFDFKVGENKYRFKVDDPGKVKEFQSDISNFLQPYIKDTNYTNLNEYHKAIFTARNADKIANHFYEQGRADAIKESAKKAKNINMDPRQEGATITTNSGDRIRVVSGDSSDKLRIKWK
tara:strand:+ start:3787 stop:5100 length:1314 start_codon:yes stop_codon:yes gene_type:complete